MSDKQSTLEFIQNKFLMRKHTSTPTHLKRIFEQFKKSVNKRVII